MSESLSGGTVSLPVRPDTSGFGRTMESGITAEASGLGALGRKLGGLLVAGIAAAGVGKVVSDIVHTGIQETMDASAGQAQLEAGIKSTGNAANVSIKSMEDLATSIQDYSGQTDDSIVASEQLLLTFTNIKNVGADKIFDDATKASADMAAKFGGDASSQAILLGKALNDPVKGITALTRVGVSFTQGQKDTIKSMVDANNTIGAQKVILAELNKEFGGAAEAAGQSLPGQIAILKRSFEDFSQSIVEKFSPVISTVLGQMIGSLQEIEGSKFFNEMLDKLSNFAKTSADKLGDLFYKIQTVFESGAKNPLAELATQLEKSNPLLAVLLTVATALKPILPELYKALEKIAPALIPLIPQLGKVVEDLLPALLQIVVALLPALPGLVQALVALTPAIVGIVDVAAWFIENDAGVIGFFSGLIQNLIDGKTHVSDFLDLFQTIPDGLKDVLRGFEDFLDPIINGAIDGLNTLSSAVATMMNPIASLLNLPGKITAFKIPHVHLADGADLIFGSAKSNGVAQGTGAARAADGGTFAPKPGGHLVNLAEAGRAETVVDTATLQAAMAQNRGGNTFKIYEAVSAWATAMQVSRLQNAARS